MNKYDAVLVLRNPKLLSNIIAHRREDGYNVNMDNILENTSSYSIKSDKINKKNYKEIDFTESKKLKNKKKAKDKINLDKHISDIKDELDLNEIKKSTVVRNSKNLKTKKNYKEKISLKNKDLFNEETKSKEIYLNDLMTAHELSLKLGVSATDIIKWLFLKGIPVTINQLLDISISTLVAKHYSFSILEHSVVQVNTINPIDSSADGRLRTPVIALLGHVDHGKTSLLKAIKADNTSIKEAGNITQSIGSYEISINIDGEIHKLIFLDTPGHEAFARMRERGADITDIVILVVAADDGLQPQTIESIHHIKSRNLPFIVAINKIDKPEANVSKVKQQLRDFDIKDENTLKSIIEISSLKGLNIYNLLVSLINISKVYQWKSNPYKFAEGTILEAYLNKQKGPIAQLLIRNGTLNVGDVIVSDNFYGKVKAILNSVQHNVNSLESTALGDVLCFAQVPKVGSAFNVVSNEKEAKLLISKYRNSKSNNITSILNNRISLDDMHQKGSRAIIKQVNLIIKTRTQGAIDAIVNTISSIPQEKVQINVLMASCGEVSFRDIDLAVTSKSIILIFELSMSTNIEQYAENKRIAVSSFYIIYDLIDYLKAYMLGFINVEYAKKIIGNGQVKSLFTINKGIVAGCLVQNGKLKKNAYFQITRGNDKEYIGLINSLKRIKDDVDEVIEGNECGIFCKEYSEWQLEDHLECYELQPLEKTL